MGLRLCVTELGYKKSKRSLKTAPFRFNAIGNWKVKDSQNNTQHCPQLQWDLQCAQFLIWAHFCKTSGEKWALFGKNMGKVYVILLSFCDLVHVQSVIDLLAKKLINK